MFLDSSVFREPHKKTVMSKKNLLHGPLTIVYQVYHSKQENKKENQVFYRDNFVFPWSFTC